MSRRDNFNPVAEEIPFENDGTDFDSINLQDAVEEAGTGVTVALNTPRYTLVLQHNGTVGNNTFFGYSNLLPGDDTPIIVPIKSDLFEFTFSNSNSNADYTLEFRKNSTTGTTFYTVSKVNTQFFVDTTVNESFLEGDEVYIKYIDDGNNASDVGLVLVFKAVP